MNDKIKTVRITKGVVCYRDENGQFTGEKKYIYSDIPANEYDKSSGLTNREKRAANEAVDNVFLPLFKKSDIFKEYISKLKKAGINTEGME